MQNDIAAAKIFLKIISSINTSQGPDTAQSSEEESEMNVFPLCLGLILLSIARADHHLHHQSEGNPKLFFVSSSSTVVTVTSTTFCFYTSMSYNQEIHITECTKRRRRGLSFEGKNKEKDLVFNVTSVLFEDEQIQEPKSQSAEIDSGMLNDEETNSARRGKFLLYWLTTTATSTSTVLRTQSIYSVLCTPSGARICG